MLWMVTRYNILSALLFAMRISEMIHSKISSWSAYASDQPTFSNQRLKLAMLEQIVTKHSQLIFDCAYFEQLNARQSTFFCKNSFTYYFLNIPPPSLKINPRKISVIEIIRFASIYKIHILPNFPSLATFTVIVQMYNDVKIRVLAFKL